MSTITRPVSIVPKGLSLARYAMALGLTRDVSTAAGMAAARDWTNTPEVKAALDLRLKTGVPAGAIGGAGAGAPLAITGMADEVLVLLRDFCSLDAMKARMREVLFLRRVSRETTSGTVGAVVPEGMSAPVAHFTFDYVALDPQKVVALTVVSQEELRLQGTAERSILAILLGGLGRVVDDAFLNPSNSTAITNGAGATAISSTGSSAAQMTTDFASMIAAITTSGANLTWIMRRTTAARIALALGAAASDIPRTFLGIPMILTASSPQQVTLVDAGEIIYADDGYDLAQSTQAAVQMDSAPTNAGYVTTSPADVVPTNVVSLWENNLAAFRQTRFLNWLRTRSGSVSYMSVSY